MNTKKKEEKKRHEIFVGPVPYNFQIKEQTKENENYMCVRTL